MTWAVAVVPRADGLPQLPGFPGSWSGATGGDADLHRPVVDGFCEERLAVSGLLADDAVENGSGTGAMTTGAGASKPIVHIQACGTSDGDGDFSLGTAAFQVAYGLGYVGEGVGLAHDGRKVTGFDVLAQGLEVRLALVGAGDVHGQPLGHHRRERDRTELPPDPGPLVAFTGTIIVFPPIQARRTR